MYKNFQVPFQISQFMVAPAGAPPRPDQRTGYGFKVMQTNRLEAFSDGVIAIIITVMVLELQIPHSDRLEDLLPVLPVFMSYVLSFVYLGIYWNNHHHMLHVTGVVTGGILWSNLHLLFWLSLVPFTTGWMGEIADGRHRLLHSPAPDHCRPG